MTVEQIATVSGLAVPVVWAAALWHLSRRFASRDYVNRVDQRVQTLETTMSQHETRITVIETIGQRVDRSITSWTSS
jgi:hypothetical protein